MYRGRFTLCILLLCLGCIISGCEQRAIQARVAHPPEMVEHIVRTPTATPTPSVVDNPARLLIPAIHVDAAIEQVGLRSDGDLDTPQDNPWNNVGWYNAGTRPGERGSSVIDGHLDRTGGAPAVFWDLRNVHVGDEVIVVMTSGKTVHFHATNIAAYQPQEAPLQGIFGDTGGNYLNLITCAGDWVPSQHQMTLRMVVYTSLG